MARPSGSALLPLHGGRVPPWLSSRMARLGRVVIEAIVLEYGADEVLRRLAHPFWFQSLGAVMGMDWHSSGITTSVLGALKRGLEPIGDELGLYVCGGRGNASRRTPRELAEVGDRTGLDGDRLARTSRLVAKVDSAAVQDGFSLYLHGFVVSAAGGWTVVQQGMSPDQRMARRYHWLAEDVTSFVETPHAAVDGPPIEEDRAILNMTDRGAAPSRAAQLALLADGPDRLLASLVEARGLPRSTTARSPSCGTRSAAPASARTTAWPPSASSTGRAAPSRPPPRRPTARPHRWTISSLASGGAPRRWAAAPCSTIARRRAVRRRRRSRASWPCRAWTARGGAESPRSAAAQRPPPARDRDAPGRARCMVRP